ncbi:MAG: hypothetical protein QXH24_05505, partial [Candidatus Bathyarchaeia archaeon]
MKVKETLGIYTIFPKKCHLISHIEFGTSLASVQKAILNVLYKLNGRRVKDALFDLIIGLDVEAILEFGVANGLSFNYFDADMLSTLLKAVNEKIFRILDFICIVRYYRLRNNRHMALRSDFFLLRFLFNDRHELEVQVFHERG